ncbi:MAG: hypothetical protein C4527_27640 [Candidatus Omnitrophota bacterium]|nr:MAG: hypothetical protein C4527_27640 [Candidatus Omnitrophota bacterium]
MPASRIECFPSFFFCVLFIVDDHLSAGIGLKAGFQIESPQCNKESCFSNLVGQTRTTVPMNK